METTEQDVIKFAAKVDEFAATLTATEQSMLADLIGGDDVTGHGVDVGWPGLGKLTSLKLGTDGYILGPSSSAIPNEPSSLQGTYPSRS